METLGQVNGLRKFTAHNVVLPDGTQTCPEVGYTMPQHPWFIAALNAIRTIVPGAPGDIRIADLGCLEGGYAAEFARLGYNALGIEARRSNFENALWVQERLGLSNLDFVRDDAWNLPRYGRFDVIYCCGLLYHLDRPRAFLEMIKDCCDKLLILNTHFATEGGTHRFNLSEITTNEGLRGRWYKEFDDGTDEETRERFQWASWDNARSFWLMRSDLIDAIRSVGFPMVWEQYDALPSVTAAMLSDGEYNTWCRSTFLAVRPAR